MGGIILGILTFDEHPEKIGQMEIMEQNEQIGVHVGCIFDLDGCLKQ